MLRECFRGYLEAVTDEPRHAMAHALDAHDLATEAMLLRHHVERGPDRLRIEQGRWAGRFAHVGPRVPAGEAFDLWLDTCELSLMILLPRRPEEIARLSPAHLATLTPFVSWLAVRPVACWQFAAFLDIAPRETVVQPYQPPFALLDPARLTAGDETASITRVTCSEAGLYLFWFGKQMPAQDDWQAATRALPGAPWGEPPREWIGESYFAEELMVAVSPTTVDVDPKDAVDTEETADRMIYSEWDAPDDVTFRSAVSTQLGLQLAPSGTSAGLTPVRLLGRLTRPAR
jgi:hypothetical protein